MRIRGQNDELWAETRLHKTKQLKYNNINVNKNKE